MGTKETLLALLEENKGSYLSGQEIAGRLAVSRASVWKAVNSLRKAGYRIDAVPNKGYSLSPDTDILSVQGITRYLKPVCRDLVPEVRQQVDSTNLQLKRQASEGAPAGRVLIAASQTAGKGRLGRSFYSPSDTGVYMSLLLRPAALKPEQAVKINTMAAVAACEAIEELTEERAGIKWVNDVFMRGKKVSGILTEGSLGLESGHLDYVILGIGFNLYPPEAGFPEGVEAVAGAIFRHRIQDGKNRLAAAFLNHFMEIYRAYGEQGSLDYAEKYRDRSLVIGRKIRVLSQGDSRPALALDVDQDCRLLVQYEDGSRETLSSGEISIRFAEPPSEESAL